MKVCKYCGVPRNGKIEFHGLVCYPCRRKHRNDDMKAAARRAIEWQRAHPERRREIALAYYYRLREAAFHAYGYKCACCGITEPTFLSIDHKKGGGNQHRRELMKRSQGNGAGFYKWLKDNNYPSDFQVLCMNCNHGTMRNGGICPHKIGKRVTTIRKRSRAKAARSA